MLAQAHLVLRTLLLVGIVGIAGWWTLFLRDKAIGHEQELAARAERIIELEEVVADRDERIGVLDAELEESAAKGAARASLAELLDELDRVRRDAGLAAPGDHPGGSV